MNEKRHKYGEVKVDNDTGSLHRDDMREVYLSR